jgi:hypothetical protein
MADAAGTMAALGGVIAAIVTIYDQYASFMDDDSKNPVPCQRGAMRAG